MKYLIAFLASLLLLAALPAYAEDEGCVTVEKFVTQNKPIGVEIEWADRKVQPSQIKPLRELLNVPPDANVTEIRLFDAKDNKKGEREAGITFGHDGLICIWASVPPQTVALILHFLEATKGIDL